MYPPVQIRLLTVGFWTLAVIVLTFGFLAQTGLDFRTFGYGGPPGYYLHSLAPALAPVIGIAITTLVQKRLAGTVVWILLGYNIVFLFGATFMQFLYFAGCGSNGSRRFNIVSASACWNDSPRLIHNLDALAYPLTALWLAAGGVIAVGWGVLTSLLNVSSDKNCTKLVSTSIRWGRLAEGAYARPGSCPLREIKLNIYLDSCLKLNPWPTSD
jgi:hypothetical protein